MHTTRIPIISARIFGVLILLSLVLSGFQGNVSPAVRAQEQFPTTPGGSNPAGAQPLAGDGTSLYYYASGQRIPLTVSLDWGRIRSERRRRQGDLSQRLPQAGRRGR